MSRGSRRGAKRGGPRPHGRGRREAGEKSAPRDGPAREAFVETAYWNPSVVTDANGRARVTFRAPTALAEYRLTALGVTGSDTMVGQTTAGLSVRQAFHVELRAPAC